MLTPYPQIVEYNEAVQHPATAFRDAELRQGQVKANALGLPVVLSGGFALTYLMSAPRRRLALRCFHREIPAAEQKYAAIARAVKALNSPYFVGFDFIPDGIRIRGGFYPVLKMEWAEGDPLGIWLDRFSGDRRAVERLRQAFAAMAAFLEQHGVAHGDIQNGNVIVSPAGDLKLVDYDGMYVPGMPAEFSCETGHKHFQHPRRTTAHFGPTIDRFSFIAVDLSLAALLEEPGLHRRFRQGGETILFRANDFADPEGSEVFRCVARHDRLRADAENFAAICRADIAAVPSLEDFRAGRNIPTAAAAAPAPRRPAGIAANPTAPPPPSASRYIAPYPVLRAEDFAAVGACVGQRVELIGRVHAVRRGRGERGRRRGQPCVFVDFGPARGDRVSLTVWTEETLLPSDIPDQRWVGRWVSIVGLIDPPVAEQHFWRNSMRVGISTATAREIDLISEDEAGFRLHRGEPAGAPSVAGGQAAAAATPASGAASRMPAGGNRHLVDRLLGAGNSRPSSPFAAPAPPASAVSRASAGRPGAAAAGWRPSRSNRAIVGALQRVAATPAVAVPARSPPAGAAGAPPPPPPPRPRTAPGFVPPRPAPAAPSRAPRPATAASRPARPTPKTGSLVIHPRNRRPLTPARVAPAPAANAWQRVLRFLGIDS